jgi:hypothetical protein
LNAIRDTISLLTQAGAVATVGIWTDLPGKWGRQYTPYDGTPTAIPGLWIDKLGGAALKDKAANGASATVVLQATTAKVRTHNVVGFIPGRSPELTVLHSHTDGTNGMEENGQLPIIATAQYLARLPLKKRERTIMVMLSSGHFHGGAGIRGWIDQHARDLLPRVTSIQTIEHVGCTEWLPDAGGEITATGHPEIGAWFAVPSAGLVAPLEAQVRRDGLTGTVARPYVAHPEAPGQRTGWPGEGTYFWLYGGLRDGNFITGPYGLITADLDTTGMVDYAHMRRSAMSSVTTTLQLAATSNRELKEAAA